MPLAVEADTAALAWAQLTILTKKRYDFLIERFGSLAQAWTRLTPKLLRELGCKEQTVTRVLHTARTLDIRQAIAELEAEKIRFVSIADRAYPDALRDIADPPVFLFAKGDINALNAPSLAIVGTRRMSTYGRRIVQAMVPDFVRAGLTTVSGLAMGIDAQTALETIEAGGKTAAVLGHGLHAVYPPRNRALADRIVQSGGLLLSEYPLGTRPDKYTFPARNRIIAGLSLGTIVAEASKKSGSLITASLALEYGREVFAVPGQIFDPNFDGTHELIASGTAKLAQDSETVLRDLGCAPPPHAPSSYRPQTPEEEEIFDSLSGMPQSVDDLVETTRLPAGAVNATLTLMELKGGARNIGAGRWVAP